MAPTEAGRALVKQLNEVNATLGLPAMEEMDPMARGAGDIAFVAPYVPGLVGTGVMGEGAHAEGETVLSGLDSAAGEADGGVDVSVVEVTVASCQWLVISSRLSCCGFLGGGVSFFVVRCQMVVRAMPATMRPAQRPSQRPTAPWWMAEGDEVADGEADDPVADDLDDEAGVGVACAAEGSGGGDLEAVEELEDGGDEEQRDGGGDDGGVRGEGCLR